MNCHETRERLSDLLDEALGPSERTEVSRHLEGCPECRRELDRLGATVSLLSRVERPRAPVGFVDRVAAAASLVPWYRKLARRLFLPLNVKLPAEAAAMLLIAVLGVYLLQRTPELRDAARPENMSPPQRRFEQSEPAKPAAPPAPAKASKNLKAGKLESGQVSETAPKAARERESAAREERRLDSPPPSPPATQESKQDLQDSDRFRQSGGPASKPAPAARAAESAVAAPAAPPAEQRAKSRDAAEGQSGAIAQAPPAMGAKRQSAMPSVVGRLNVTSRPAADQGLADLLGRLGGSEVGRRQELGATVVEVLVPVARYADFVGGLNALGAFTTESQPVALSTEPPQFRLSIRITE